MRKLVLALPILLVACGGGVPLELDNPKVALGNACHLAGNALEPAIVARHAGKLGPSFIAGIQRTGTIIDVWCRKGGVPPVTRQADGSLAVSWSSGLAAVRAATGELIAMMKGVD